jgi:hypothetical protein
MTGAFYLWHGKWRRRADMEKCFQPSEVDEIVRLVLAAKEDVLLQEDEAGGCALTVGIVLTEQIKKDLIRSFCSRSNGGIRMFCPLPSVKVKVPPAQAEGTPAFTGL